MICGQTGLSGFTVWYVLCMYVCTVQLVSQMLSFVKDISVVLLCEVEMKRLLIC